MKDVYKYLIGGAIVAILFFWFNGCGNKQSKITTVTIPEQKGVMPEVINAEPVLNEKTEQYKVAEKVYIEVPIPADDKYKSGYFKLLNEYQATKDSLERLKKYADAISVNEYSIPLEDSLVGTINKMTVQGKLLSFEQSYTIKERKLDIKIPEVTFRMLAGIEVGNTINLDRFTAKGNIMFQNRKGNLITISADTEKTLYIGHVWNIWTVKK